MTELELALETLNPASRFIVNYGTVFTYILFGVAILLIIGFSAIQMFQDFKKAISAIVGVGALVLLFMLCYWLSAAEPLTYITAEGDKFTPGSTMKIVEACIYMAYFMFCGAILALIVTSFARYLK